MFASLPQIAKIVEPGGAATHTFTAAGVYTVKLTVKDSCDGSGTANRIEGLGGGSIVIQKPG